MSQISFIILKSSVSGVKVFHFTLQPLFINLIIIYDKFIFINQKENNNLAMF